MELRHAASVLPAVSFEPFPSSPGSTEDYPFLDHHQLVPGTARLQEPVRHPQPGASDTLGDRSQIDERLLVPHITETQISATGQMGSS